VQSTRLCQNIHSLGTEGRSARGSERASSRSTARGIKSSPQKKTFHAASINAVYDVELWGHPGVKARNTYGGRAL
jgi:hypothetical protein